MHSSEIAGALAAGCVLIAFGLIPGLLDGVMEGIRNIQSLLESGYMLRPAEPAQPSRPLWLVGLGVIALLLAALGYVSN